jgi:cytoskeletal protein RodZ
MSSFGEELRRERELRQISLREVSEATKINVRYLEALERNDFRHLPGGVFNKGFVRAYAQFIGVDPETMVNSYLLEERAQGDDGSAGNGEVIRRPSPPQEEPPGPVEAGFPLRQVLVVVGILVAVGVIGGAAYWWWQTHRTGPEPHPVASDIVRDEREIESPAPGSEAGKPDPVAPDDETIGGSELEQEAVPEPEPPEPDRTPEVSTAGAESREPPVAATSALVAGIRLVRGTSGRVNCDNRRVEILDGLAPGTELTFRCERFLLLSAADGGAVQIGVDGAPMTPLAADGSAVADRRFVPQRDEAEQ